MYLFKSYTKEIGDYDQYYQYTLGTLSAILLIALLILTPWPLAGTVQIQDASRVVLTADKPYRWDDLEFLRA